MRVSADDKDRASLAREFFTPDHPHFVTARIEGQAEPVPGMFVVSPIETDERITEVKSLRVAAWDARNAAQGKAVTIGVETYTVNQRERDGVYFALINLSETA